MLIRYKQHLCPGVIVQKNQRKMCQKWDTQKIKEIGIDSKNIQSNNHFQSNNLIGFEKVTLLFDNSGSFVEL